MLPNIGKYGKLYLHNYLYTNLQIDKLPNEDCREKKIREMIENERVERCFYLIIL